MKKRYTAVIVELLRLSSNEVMLISQTNPSGENELEPIIGGELK